jgi:hypothetical protein
MTFQAAHRWQTGQPRILTIDERRAILQRMIQHYVRQGYHVVNQTDTTAQMLKPKTFSLFWALMWFLMLGLGLIVYLLWYWAKRDQVVYLSVNEYGR